MSAEAHRRMRPELRRAGWFALLAASGAMAILLLGSASPAGAVSLPCDGVATVTGTEQDDYLSGDPGNVARHDNIAGLGGNDRIDGFQWSDCLFGGFGTDQLFGGKHRDRVNGQQGTDYLYGGDAEDVLIGDADSPAPQSPDWLYGGGENDDLFGGKGGGDWCYGQAGNDTYHDCEHIPN